MNEPRIILSTRGIPLVLTQLPDRPTLTVENYPKWYDLYIVTPAGTVISLTNFDTLKRSDALEARFDSDECPEPATGDHCYNPAWVAQVAEVMELEIDSVSMDVIIGRWETDYRNNYEFGGACETCTKCGEKYDPYGDGYCGLCPSCADKAEPQ